MGMTKDQIAAKAREHCPAPRLWHTWVDWIGAVCKECFDLADFVRSIADEARAEGDRQAVREREEGQKRVEHLLEAKNEEIEAEKRFEMEQFKIISQWHDRAKKAESALRKAEDLVRNLSAALAEMPHPDSCSAWDATSSPRPCDCPAKVLKDVPAELRSDK